MMGLRAAAVLAMALFAAGPAQARRFLVRTAGAATAVAIDRDSVIKTGHYRTGWAYEFYREHNPFVGERTQITGVLLLADCKTLLARRLKVVRYLADGRTLAQTGPERPWTDAPAGANSDQILRAMCAGPDPDWARRKADSVFELYRKVWR
jgi:hypothetical protein